MLKNKETIAIGCDHAGYKLKEELKNYLLLNGFSIEDFGCHSIESIDYPDFGHAVAGFVEKNKTKGIVICGSGNGINMTINKHQNIRGALCWTEEITELSRLHNDANIIALPARFITVDQAKKMLKIFFSTEFEGGRHQKRIKKIPC
jgi:ribose 5-phosphate isomerase B